MQSIKMSLKWLKEQVKNVNIETFLLTLLTIVCSYQSIFSLKFSFLDEILIIILGGYELYKIYWKKEKLNTKFFYAKIILGVIFISLTFINVFLKKYNIKAYIGDIFNYLKLFILIEIISLINMDDSKFKNCMKVFLIVNFVSIIYGIFTSIFYEQIGFKEGDKIRNGLYRISGITGHTIALGFTCLIIIMYLMEKVKKSKLDWIGIAICLIALWLTYSRLPQALCLLYIIVKYGYSIGIEKLGKERFWKLVLILIVICIIITCLMFEKIMMYLQKDINDTIRFYALIKAGEVLKKYPILGTGIGTFSSSASIKYNSYVYEEFSFDRFMDKATESAGNLFESSLAKITIETRYYWNFISYSFFCILL